VSRLLCATHGYRVAEDNECEECRALLASCRADDEDDMREAAEAARWARLHRHGFVRAEEP
jgi:hypothetical protein